MCGQEEEPPSRVAVCACMVRCLAVCFSVEQMYALAQSPAARAASTPIPEVSAAASPSH